MADDHSPLIRSLRAAVAAAPDDVTLRLHLAQLLLDDGQRDPAVVEIAAALQREPGNPGALAMMTGLAAAPVAAVRPPAAPGQSAPSATALAPDQSAPPEAAPVPGRPSPVSGEPGTDAAGPSGFDGGGVESEPDGAGRASVPADAADEPAVVTEAEPAGITLADVAGMEDVKKRLNAAFLAPMRNPKLRAMYRKSLRGGLLLYGPPGCGKTFVAKAVAGELGANFVNVTLNDVLDRWLGTSESNLHDVFVAARDKAPCVLFFDELDAIGAKRDQVRYGGMRNVVNQLLGEMDGVDADNEGVYLLAATNFPWDVDTALRRPGRFDRTVLVTPPDRLARQRVLQLNLADRPVETVDLAAIAKRSEGFSGADLAHLCELATERALMDSVETGRPRLIGQPDLVSALEDIRPSADPWFATARNVALFSNEDGNYDDLVKYLKKHRKW